MASEALTLSERLLAEAIESANDLEVAKLKARIAELEAQLAQRDADPLDVYETKPLSPGTVNELRRIAQEHHERERRRIADEIHGPRIKELEEALKPLGVDCERELNLPDDTIVMVNVPVGTLRIAQSLNKGKKPWQKHRKR